MQKSVRYNEGHALFLSVVARKEGTKRGYLSKKTAENSRWSEKFFALYQNVLFYFENEQSARPAGIYLLEGCTCERTPAPKISTTGKEALEKQILSWHSLGVFTPAEHRLNVTAHLIVYVHHSVRTLSYKNSNYSCYSGIVFLSLKKLE
uniref:PH domain-containing protein n=1 Tax=Poecilia latipinna TaxID=48699 RepID=A0A3B3TTM5_9TELE